MSLSVDALFSVTADLLTDFAALFAATVAFFCVVAAFSLLQLLSSSLTLPPFPFSCSLKSFLLSFSSFTSVSFPHAL